MSMSFEDALIAHENKAHAAMHVQHTRRGIETVTPELLAEIEAENRAALPADYAPICEDPKSDLQQIAREINATPVTPNTTKANDDNDKWKAKLLKSSVRALRKYYCQRNLIFDEEKKPQINCIECGGVVNFFKDEDEAKFKCGGCGKYGDIISLALEGATLDNPEWAYVKALNHLYKRFASICKGKYNHNAGVGESDGISSSSNVSPPVIHTPAPLPPRGLALPHHNICGGTFSGRTEWLKTIARRTDSANERFIAQLILDSADTISTDPDYYAKKCCITRKWARKLIEQARQWGLFDITIAAHTKDAKRGLFAAECVKRVNGLTLQLLCLIFARMRQKSVRIDFTPYNRKQTIRILTRWQSRGLLTHTDDIITLKGAE